jgi:peptide/nickel transport system permease protein
MLAFPPLILLLGLAAVLQRNVRNITLALAVISIPTFIRLSRANTLVLAQREFVVAVRALGARSRRIIFRDLLPGALLPLTSYAFAVVAVIIVAEASLSFLGLGIPRPTPTLGNMIAAGQDSFQTHPHMVFVPATALFLTVFCLNRIGEEARRRWDPRDAKI